MTFRGRLVIAATVAVAIAVLLAAGGAFYFSRNALINSLDGQLANTAQSIIGPPNANPVIDGPQAYGDGLQIADASGSVVAGTGDKRVEAMRISEIFRAHIVDTTHTSFVFEITGAPEKLDNFIDLMRPLGLVDVSRTGVAAISRGPEAM